MQWLRNLWYRIKSIFSANAHAALDRAEDPALMADEYIRQLSTQYTDIKKGVAEAMAQATRMAQKRDQNREEAERWERNAVAALKREDEEMARQALERKRQYASTASEYAVQCETQEAQVKDLRTSLTRIETQISEARAKRDLIKAKSGRVRSQEAFGKAQRGMSGTGSMFERIGAMEEHVDDRLYKAEAMAKLETDSLSNRFENLEQDLAIDDELSLLKERLGQSGE